MLELVIVLLVILALVTLNGLFVAAEFAIVGAPRAVIAARAESGDKLAGRIAATLEDPTRLDRYVATAQIGITFASLGLGMYGEHMLAVFFERWLRALELPELGAMLTAHGLAVVLAIIAITYLHIVLGEMIPKALALSHAVPVALWVTPPMLFIGLVLYPLVRGLNRTGSFLLHLAGIERGRSAEHYLAADELESIARESREGGLLSAESGRIFQELSEFSAITAAQAMVPRVHTRGIPADATDAMLREILPLHRHTRYPVYAENLDRIIGTVHIKELLGALHTGSGLVPALVRETAYLPETATLDDVLAAMERARNQMIVVMDEHGGTAGILTIEDICAEAVGDVEEGADDIPDVLPIGRDRFQVQGMVRLGTLGTVIGADLKSPDVDSVSGLILSELGRPPQVGDRIHWNGLSFEVSSLHGRGVREAIVSPDREDGDATGSASAA